MIWNRFQVLWSILVGTTFVCCSLLIFNVLIQQKNSCTDQERCSRTSRIQAEKLEDENCKSVCTTKECITISNYILSNMDQSVDPCEDFYDFACGNYAEKFYKGSNYSTIESLKDDLYKTLKDFIETSKESEFPDSAAQKLKIVYDSCMNTESSEVTTIVFMKDFLSHIGIPNWPFLNSNFTFVKPTLEEALGKLASFEEYVFVRFHISNVRSYVLLLQERNTDLFNLSVSPQIQTYHEDSQISKLKEIVTGILLHAGMDYENINSPWDDFLSVEKGIANIIKDYYELNITCEEDGEETVFYSNYTQEESSKSILFKILESVVRNAKLTSRFSTEKFVISCHYQYYMEKIVDVINTNSHRAIAHYMALRIFINNLKYMNFPIRKNLIYAILEPYDRDDSILELDKWKFCISWLATHMKYSLGLFYVTDMWPKKAVDELNDMFNEYKNTTIAFIQNQGWIESKVKTKLAQEVEEEENVINRVFEVYKNKTRINEYYEEFHPSRGSFISNVLKHKKFHFMATHLSPHDELIFQAISPFEATAWGGGNIYLSFGIMLPPVFNHKYPKLFNLAKLGQIIGHEIGHKMLNFFDKYKIIYFKLNLCMQQKLQKHAI